MTRSILLHRRVPRLAAPPLGLLLALALAAAGCAGGGDASAAASASLSADDPAGPDASSAVSAAADGDTTEPSDPTPAAPASTVAGTTGTTRATTSSSPSTTVRPATTIPPSSVPSTSSPPSTPTSTTATTGGGAAGQRLTGTVTASPTCPVERPDQPCAPRPVAGAHIEAFDRAENLVASTQADAEGRFSLTLTSGRYVLTAGSGAVFPSCPPLTVDVPASGAARADIACDTGIR